MAGFGIYANGGVADGIGDMADCGDAECDDGAPCWLRTGLGMNVFRGLINIGLWA